MIILHGNTYNCDILQGMSFEISDQLFPIDIGSVEKDHDFLDKDSIQSLFRWVKNDMVILVLKLIPKTVTLDRFSK